MSHRLRSMALGLAFPLCASLTCAAAASAQTEPTKNLVAVNPIGVVFEVFSGEYERAVTDRVTLGAAGTLWRSSQDLEDEAGSQDASVTYVSADAKLRYYPGAALAGFSLGALAGATRLGGDVRSCPADAAGCDEEAGSVMALSAGVEIDYAWRLGADRSFVVATGLGAKRLFPMTEDEIDATLAYPFVRLVVGYSF